MLQIGQLTEALKTRAYVFDLSFTVRPGACQLSYLSFQFLRLLNECVKFDNSDETYKFFEEYNLPKLTEEEIENLNSPVSI